MGREATRKLHANIFTLEKFTGEIRQWMDIYRKIVVILFFTISP